MASSHSRSGIRNCGIAAVMGLPGLKDIRTKLIAVAAIHAVISSFTASEGSGLWSGVVILCFRPKRC